MAWHTAESIHGRSGWQRSGPLSISGRHRLQAGHQGWVHQAELGWREGWCGSAERETSCLGRSAQCMAIGTAVLKLTLQDVQTDSAEAVDVGVIDFGEETDLGRGHGVVVWQKELELEDST